MEQVTGFFSLTIILLYISQCSGKHKNDIDPYLYETEVTYSEATEELRVSFRFVTPVINGQAYDKNVSVVGQDGCEAVQQSGDYYTYVFAYDGTSPCQGQKTTLDYIRTRYHVTLNFESWRDSPLGIPIFFMYTDCEFETIVTSKPTHIPSTLAITPDHPVTEPTNGDVVNITVGYTDTDTIWDALVVQTCTVANNEHFSNDVEQNNHSEVAFLNGCPESISTGMVLTEQKIVMGTFTQLSVGWTLAGFNYGDDKLWIRCEVKLCDIRDDCSLHYCPNTRTRSVAAVESRDVQVVTATVEFSIEGIQYPSTEVPESCGIQDIGNVPGNGYTVGKIIGGTISIAGSWPWQVQLKAYGQHQCGGTILSSEWVLTAARCFNLYPFASAWTVHAGSWSERNTDSTETIHPVETIVRHSEYSADTYDHDIALVKVSTPISFTSHRKPVCLPESVLKPLAGTMCYVTGWGLTHNTGYSGYLKQTYLPIVSDTLCRLAHPGVISNNMICAGYTHVNIHRPCHGDTGGPLVHEVSGVWYLEGVLSYMDEHCSDMDKPAVFSSTRAHANWIQANMHN